MIRAIVNSAQMPWFIISRYSADLFYVGRKQERIFVVHQCILLSVLFRRFLPLNVDEDNVYLCRRVFNPETPHREVEYRSIQMVSSLTGVVQYLALLQNNSIFSCLVLSDSVKLVDQLQLVCECSLPNQSINDSFVLARWQTERISGSQCIFFEDYKLH